MCWENSYGGFLRRQSKGKAKDYFSHSLNQACQGGPQRYSFDENDYLIYTFIAKNSLRKHYQKLFMDHSGPKAATTPQ